MSYPYMGYKVVKAIGANWYYVEYIRTRKTVQEQTEAGWKMKRFTTEEEAHKYMRNPAN